MKIGVSSCLLGNKVRYDGTGTKDNFIVDNLTKYFQFIPFCPESVIFGTPRDTIRLINQNNEIIVSNNKTKENVTNILNLESSKQTNMAFDFDLCGFILKSKSPTCGLEKVKVYDDKHNTNIKNGVGVFAAQLKDKMPSLPIEEEGRLNDAWLRENFLMQVFAYSNLKSFLNNSPKLKNLIEFHTNYKYLILSKSQEKYNILGNIVANKENLPLEQILKIYEKEFLISISIKNNRKKVFNVLLHIFGYFKKNIDTSEKELVLTILNDFKEGVVPLISIINIFNIYILRYNNQYLKKQVFLNPYPKDLILRSDLKSFK